MCILDYTVADLEDLDKIMMAFVYFRAVVLLVLYLVMPGIQGQLITPANVVTAVGDDVFLTCTTNMTTPIFSWIDVTAGQTIYIGGTKIYPFAPYADFDLDEDVDAQESTMIINDILLIHERQYRCDVMGLPGEPAGVVVEVGSSATYISLESVNSDTWYKATCLSDGSKPEEILTWILDGEVQTDNITEDYIAPPINGQIYKNSVFLFPASLENYNVPLECDISGHQVTKLNRQVSRLVDIHSPPGSGVIEIIFAIEELTLIVTCETLNEPLPALDSFYIYLNGTKIHESTNSVNTAKVPKPQYDTEFRCVGENYLGDTTTTGTYETSSASIAHSFLSFGLTTSIVLAAMGGYDII